GQNNGPVRRARRNDPVGRAGLNLDPRDRPIVGGGSLNEHIRGADDRPFGWSIDAEYGGCGVREDGTQRPSLIARPLRGPAPEKDDPTRLHLLGERVSRPREGADEETRPEPQETDHVIELGLPVRPVFIK